MDKDSLKRFIKYIEELSVDLIQKDSYGNIVFGHVRDLERTVEEFKWLSDSFEINVEFSNSAEEFFDPEGNLVTGKPINYIEFKFTGFSIKVYSFNDNFKEAHKIYLENKAFIKEENNEQERHEKTQEKI